MMIPIKTKAYLKIFCSIFSPPFLIIRHGGAAVLNNYDNGCNITLIHNGTILFDKGLPSSKKKKDTQRLSAGISKEGDIYTINKIFTPIFNISYRTRGGVNVHFSAEEIGEMLKGQFQKSKLSTSTKRKRISPTKDIKNIPPADQLSFFDWGEGK